MTACDLNGVPSFEVARELGRRKEQAIKEALDYHFGGDNWTDQQAADVASMNIYGIGGGEELVIDGVVMLDIGPIRSKLEIDDGMVRCLFGQNIEVKYGS